MIRPRPESAAHPGPDSAPDPFSDADPLDELGHQITTLVGDILAAEHPAALRSRDRTPGRIIPKIDHSCRKNPRVVDYRGWGYPFNRTRANRPELRLLRGLDLCGAIGLH